MDPIGATDEPGAGLMERDADGFSSVPDGMDAAGYWRHTVGNVFIPGRVDGVAVTYRQPSIVKV